jgi:N-acetyl-anhydromuramyl-L-alanine amidase AmpD
MPRKAKLLLALVVLVNALGLALWTLAPGRRDPEPNPAARTPPAEPGWMPAQKSDRWKCIVLHHSASDAGSAARFDEWHRSKGWDELGYHFVIGNGSGSADGQVEVGPRWAGQKHGAHCKSPGEYHNQHGIGICLVGNFDTHRPSPKQIQSLNKLVIFLCGVFDIDPAQIMTHGAVTGETRCPGKNFDVEAVRRAVEAPPAAARAKSKSKSTVKSKSK